MSARLAILARAGLVRAERQSRSIIYRADLDTLRTLTVFLVKDCCEGRPELCAPLIEDLIPRCREARPAVTDILVSPIGVKLRGPSEVVLDLPPTPRVPA